MVSPSTLRAGAALCLALAAPARGLQVPADSQNASLELLEWPWSRRSAGGAKAPAGTGKVLLSTMTFPEDNLPLDVTVAHQVRMISMYPGNIQHVIVDNRPPWMEPVNRQETILQSMSKSKISTVRRVDYGVYDSPKYLQKFFETGNSSDSCKTLEDAHDVSDISGQHMSSNTHGMFNFLEACLNAEAAVDLCVFLDPDIVVYRKDKGIIEMAREVFAAQPTAIALNPPTMCSAFDEAGSGTCKTKRPGMLSQRYLIIHRQRLTGALPLKIPHEQFNVNFEHLFGDSLRSLNSAGQRMICNGAFAIHPFSARWGHCRNNKQNLNIERHSKLVAQAAKKEKSGDYHSFEMTMVEGLKEMITRVEAGKLAKPQESGEPAELQSASNMCEDMCVDQNRIAQGLAW